MLAEAQRRDLLAAMGVDVYVLRGLPSSAGSEIANVIRILVFCNKADASHPNTAVLRHALPRALGCDPAQIDWIEAANDGDWMQNPAARVCLMLGADVARLAKARSANASPNDTLIAVADAAQMSLANALARRALWQALKPIARYLRDICG